MDKIESTQVSCMTRDGEVMIDGFNKMVREYEMFNGVRPKYFATPMCSVYSKFDEICGVQILICKMLDFTSFMGHDDFMPGRVSALNVNYNKEISFKTAT